MLGTRLFRRLCLAACMLPVGCAAGLAADEAAERRELLGNITQGVIEFLCEAEGPYLGCLKITSEQCRTELKPISKICRERMLGDMPEISEENRSEAHTSELQSLMRTTYAD